MFLFSCLRFYSESETKKLIKKPQSFSGFMKIFGTDLIDFNLIILLFLYRRMDIKIIGCFTKYINIRILR